MVTTTNDELARLWQQMILDGHGRELYDRMVRLGADIGCYAGALEFAVLEAAQAYKTGHCSKARRIIMRAAKVAKARSFNAEVAAVCAELDTEEEAARLRALN